MPKMRGVDRGHLFPQRMPTLFRCPLRHPFCKVRKAAPVCCRDPKRTRRIVRLDLRRINFSAFVQQVKQTVPEEIQCHFDASISNDVVHTRTISFYHHCL